MSKSTVGCMFLSVCKSVFVSICSGVYFQGTTIGMAPIMSMCTAEQSGGIVMVSGISVISKTKLLIIGFNCIM